MSVQAEWTGTLHRLIELPELTAADAALLLAMPPLLAVYAFFSFIETTYFALTPAERLSLRRVFTNTKRKWLCPLFFPAPCCF